MEEEIEKSSGNLYADLGFKNAEEMEAKAALARAIYRIIKQKKLSQPKAAELLGIKQPALCKLLQGNLTGFSTDRLLKFLNQLGLDVDIKIKPAKAIVRRRTVGRTSVSTSSNFCSSVPMAAKGKA
jgi:predicted XRE-type DNA-binding protein